MSFTRKLGQYSIWLGILGLAATVTLHLTLGLPPIENAIEKGFITKGPGIRPSELVAIWTAFSLIFYILLVGLVTERLSKQPASGLLSVSIGAAAMCCAFVMNTMIPGGHIAFPLLLVPGILLMAGTILEKIDRK